MENFDICLSHKLRLNSDRHRMGLDFCLILAYNFYICLSTEYIIFRQTVKKFKNRSSFCISNKIWINKNVNIKQQIYTLEMCNIIIAVIFLVNVEGTKISFICNSKSNF